MSLSTAGYDGRMPSPPAASSTDALRLGVVCFLNTIPLIDGLDRLDGLDLRFTVPSLLIDELVGGAVDVALCSSIDYQRSPVPLTILPVGLLGCHGPTLTVRLYASRPIEACERIYCDTDSHTSVALLRIVLAEQYGLTPELVPYDAREHVAENRPIDWPPAMLLIGDKVVTDSPPAVRYPHQLDLGKAWHDLTGSPFVFAAWMARRDAPPERLRRAAAILDRQRRYNRMHLGGIVARAAEARHWPKDLAADYLGTRLDFDFDESRREALDTFFRKALEHGLLDSIRPLHLGPA